MANMKPDNMGRKNIAGNTRTLMLCWARAFAIWNNDWNNDVFPNFVMHDWPSLYLAQNTGDARRFAGSPQVNVKSQEDYSQMTLSLLHLVKDAVPHMRNN